MTEAEKAVFAHVAAVRERLVRAKARGQIELHLAVEDVDLLLALAEIVKDAKEKKA